MTEEFLVHISFWLRQILERSTYIFVPSVLLMVVDGLLMLANTPLVLCLHLTDPYALLLLASDSLMLVVVQRLLPVS